MCVSLPPSVPPPTFFPPLLVLCRYGRISGKAMTFLERKGVIDKEFQFRFMKKQDETEELFFACPAKCGKFLVDVDPTLIMRKGEVSTKIERCPCGEGVCVQCHQLVEDSQFEKHKCPELTKGTATDAETLKMMKKLGKKCPNCSMFIIKNEGCDVMMCGDKVRRRRGRMEGGMGGWMDGWMKGRMVYNHFLHCIA